MKIKDLPKVIKKRAKSYIDKKFKAKLISLSGAFNWTETKEGFDYWFMVYEGKFVDAENLLLERLKTENPLLYKINQINEDACWAGTSTDCSKEGPLIAKMIEELENAKPIVGDTVKWSEEGIDRDSPFFLDQVLDLKVNDAEVILKPWYLTTDDAPIFYREDKRAEDPIVEAVREKLKQRSAVGIKKYGTTLDRDDLSLEQWLDHATEEAMDLCLYLTKIKEELKNK
jgi:hypothetical protein